MNTLYKSILDILFPPLCVSCSKYLHSDHLGPICELCFEGITLKPYLSPAEVISIGSYEDETLRKLIHTFKYEKIRSIDKTIGALIKKYLKQEPFLLNAENSIIVPIPLHPKKERKRGFNQAEVIAQILGKQLKIEVRTDIVKRIKNTDPQISLKNSKERAVNIKDAFKLLKNAETKIQNKNIIVVDDVYTSGATIKEASRILKKLNPKKITAFVIAKV